MKRKFKALIFVLLSPFIVLALYIGFLWVTYIDQTVTTGQKYGFTIGATKHQTYKNVIKLLIETLEYCHAIDCRILVVHPNHPDSLHIGNEKVKTNSIKLLKEIVPKAQEYNVRLALLALLVSFNLLRLSNSFFT